MKLLKRENLPLYNVEKAEVSLMEGQVLQRLAIPCERNCNLFFFKRAAFPFGDGNAALFCFRDFGELAHVRHKEQVGFFDQTAIGGENRDKFSECVLEPCLGKM